MDYIDITIPEDKIEEFKNANYTKLDKYVREHLPNNIINGYGYYGHRGLTTANNKTYIRCNIGDSCD